MTTGRINQVNAETEVNARANQRRRIATRPCDPETAGAALRQRVAGLFPPRPEGQVPRTFGQRERSIERRGRPTRTSEPRKRRKPLVEQQFSAGRFECRRSLGEGRGAGAPWRELQGEPAANLAVRRESERGKGRYARGRPSLCTLRSVLKVERSSGP